METCISTKNEKLDYGIFKGWAHYIFASLLCNSNGKHLWNKEKGFLLHSERSFCSWDFNYTETWNTSTKHILLYNLLSTHNLVVKSDQFI